MSKKYFHIAGNSRFGPFSTVELKQRAAAGLIAPDHQIQEDGSPKSFLASTVGGLFSASVGSDNTVSARTSSPKVPVPSRHTVQASAGSKENVELKRSVGNPVAELLSSLTTCTLDSMYARVQRGELSQQDFEQAGRALLRDLESAVRFVQSETGTSAIRSSSRNKLGEATQTGNANTRVNSVSTGAAGPARGRTLPGSQPSDGDIYSQTAPLPPTPLGGRGASALGLGLAALAGGVGGYLLGRQGNAAAYGATNGPHDAGTLNGDGGGHEAFQHGADAAESHFVASSQADADSYSESRGIGADTNNDGLIDSFFQDTNADGVADAVARDSDFDGNFDRVSLDSDLDGRFDQNFVEEAIDADDVSFAEDENVDLGDDGDASSAADDPLDDIDESNEPTDDVDLSDDWGGDADVGYDDLE